MGTATPGSQCWRRSAGAWMHLLCSASKRIPPSLCTLYKPCPFNAVLVVFPPTSPGAAPRTSAIAFISPPLAGSGPSYGAVAWALLPPGGAAGTLPPSHFAGVQRARLRGCCGICFFSPSQHVADPRSLV